MALSAELRGAGDDWLKSSLCVGFRAALSDWLTLFRHDERCPTEETSSSGLLGNGGADFRQPKKGLNDDSRDRVP